MGMVSVLNGLGITGPGDAAKTAESGNPVAKALGKTPENPFLAGLEPLSLATGPNSGGLNVASGDGTPGRMAEPRPAPGYSLDRGNPQSLGSALSPAISPANPSPPNTTVPEFAKPKTDEKLFKPLKRF